MGDRNRRQVFTAIECSLHNAHYGIGLAAAFHFRRVGIVFICPLDCFRYHHVAGIAAIVLQDDQLVAEMPAAAHPGFAILDLIPHAVNVVYEGAGLHLFVSPTDSCCQ